MTLSPLPEKFLKFFNTSWNKLTATDGPLTTTLPKTPPQTRVTLSHRDRGTAILFLTPGTCVWEWTGLKGHQVNQKSPYFFT